MDEDLQRGGEPDRPPVPGAGARREELPGASAWPGGRGAVPDGGDSAQRPEPPGAAARGTAGDEAVGADPPPGPAWWGTAAADADGPVPGPPAAPGAFYGQQSGAAPCEPCLLLAAGAGRSGSDSWALGWTEGAARRRARSRAAAVVAGVALIAGGVGAGLGVALAPASSPSGGQGPAGIGAPPGGGGAGGSAGGRGASPSTSGNGGNLVRSIAAAVDPAVVDINVENATVGPAAGTGMIISPSGYVLTNNHVIDNAVTVRVTIAGRSEPAAATVVGYDSTDDVALLKIHGVSGLPTVHFANSSTVPIGATVVVIGNALGQGGAPTVVSGAITALGRTISANDAITNGSEILHGLLQTDAQIQSGDSGGPMVDAKGDVIGMDTAAAQAETGGTIGFAIPINEARAIADRILAGHAGGNVVLGLSPFLGITAYPQGEGPASGGNNFGGLFGSSGASGPAPTVSGVPISSVTPSSPAARAGLQSGDVITAVGGRQTPTFAALHADIQARRPGEKLSVTYVNLADRTVRAVVTLIGIPH